MRAVIFTWSPRQIDVVPSNQALHHDLSRILVSRDTMPLQRPRRVNLFVSPQAKATTLRPTDEEKR
jgi:hypothetical protein